ncbi:MAG: hypothetical protein ACREV9_06530 [Burkholderiales bacterium]
MLTLTECVEFCDLTQDEVHEIAEHEHVPEIVAVEIGHSLLKSPNGIYTLRGYLLDNLDRAASNGNLKRARYLNELITSFNRTHSVSSVL